MRVDAALPSGSRMPNGNELGVNNQWIPGGYTNGGVPEATIDQLQPALIHHPQYFHYSEHS